MHPFRTRIKLCGLTRAQDVAAAVAAGADALGFIFYTASPRFVAPQAAAKLIAPVPAFVTKVGLFVNASTADVVQTVHATGIDLIQFHGDETPQFCEATARAAHRPYIRAIGVAPHSSSADLLNSITAYSSAKGFLFDTASARFEWWLERAKRRRSD
jgi:phosphoribosylanthranilate isomerase